MLTITVNNPPADLAIELYDKNQTYISRSDNSGSEQLVYSVTSTGYYYIVLGSSNGGYSCSNYSLQVSWIASASCTDSFEPNNTIETANTGAFATLGTSNRSNSITATIHASSDVDYYRLNITKNGTLTVNMPTPPGDYDMALFDAGGTQLAYSNSYGSETFTYSVNSVGNYYLQVFGFDNVYSCTSYSLGIEWTPAEDPYLNVTGSPVNLSSSSGSQGTFTISSNTSWNISDDANWLTVSPESGTNNGSVTVTAISANTGTTVRNATVTIAASGAAIRTITVTQAIPQGQSNLKYDLSAAIVSISGTYVSLSFSVINDGNGQASENQVGYYLWSNPYPSSSDILIGSSQVPSLAPGGSSYQSLNTNVLSVIPNAPSGTYYVAFVIDYLNAVAESNESDNTAYFLQQITIPCGGDDVYEPNNSIETASTNAFGRLEASNYQNTIAAVINSSTDFDFYRLEVTNVGKLTVSMPNPPADYDILLTDASGSTLASSYTLGSETFTYSVNSSGYYFVFVYGYDNVFSCSSYSLGIEWLPGEDPYLNVTGLPVSLAAASGSKGTFTISSNLSWSIVDDATWLSVSPESGVNNGTITLTARNANTGTMARNATVTISGTGVATQAFEVEQNHLMTALENSNSEVSEISVAPNPSSGIFTLVVPTIPGENYQLEIFNGSGNLILKEMIPATSTSFSKEYDFTSNPGVYYLRVMNNENTMQCKFIIR